MIYNICGNFFLAFFLNLRFFLKYFSLNTQYDEKAIFFFGFCFIVVISSYWRNHKGIRRVNYNRENERYGVLFCYSDLSLAGCDVLLSFVFHALLMGNNVTMIRAIIPILSVCPPQGTSKKVTKTLRFQPLQPLMTLISSNIVAEVIQEWHRDF